MSTVIQNSSSNNFKASHAAHSLNSSQRQEIAVTMRGFQSTYLTFSVVALPT